MGKITIRGGGMLRSHKKQFRNARRRFGTAIQNILSALYAQSATTTTAASGGNRRSCWGRVLIFQSPAKGLQKISKRNPSGPAVANL